MNRTMLIMSLLAVTPAMTCGQGTKQQIKVVNCRTLEAAGNFVGPDEVIVNDLVCQRVKAEPQPEARVQPQARGSLQGEVVSGTESISVVDAAKAANKRLAERIVQIREEKSKEAARTAKPATEAPAASEASPDTLEKNSEPTAAPAGPEDPATAPQAPVAPTKKPQPRLMPKPPATQIAAAAEPIHEDNSAAKESEETVSVQAAADKPAAAAEVTPSAKVAGPEVSAAMAPTAAVSDPAKAEQAVSRVEEPKVESVVLPVETPKPSEAAPEARAGGPSADSVKQTASREPAGTTEAEATSQTATSTAKAGEVEGAEGSRPPECAKSKWWKPWAKCKPSTKSEE